MSANSSTYTIPSGSQGSPSLSASWDTHSVTITPMATDTTGYITGSTKYGSPSTIYASDLVSGSTTITTNTTTNVTNYASVITNVPQAIPIEISSDAGMLAVLTAANVGKAYKFTGTTGTYTNGDIYIVEGS